MKTILAFIKHIWKYDVVLVLLALIVFAPVTYAASTSTAGLEITDYGPHVEFTVEFVSQLKGGEATRPAIWARGAWQLLLMALHNLVGIPYDYVSFIGAMLCIVVAILVIFHTFKPTLEKRGISPWWGTGIAIGLYLVAPIALFAPIDGHYYFGYVGMITYHNPTSIMLRSIVVLQFIYALACFQEKPSPWPQVLVAAFFSLLSLYTKPNYALCLFPAMGLVFLVRLLKRQAINWRMAIFGVALPSAAMLAWQYWAVYNVPGGAFWIRPFFVMASFSDYLLPKFLLSILFPLLVGIFYFRDIARDIRMILAWITFAFGIFYVYIFAENAGAQYLNWTWGSHFATWILFGLSAILVIEKAATDKKWKTWTLAVVAGMHLVSGIFFYLSCLLANNYW